MGCDALSNFRLRWSNSGLALAFLSMGSGAAELRVEL
jgi:hypothetical protein